MSSSFLSHKLLSDHARWSPLRRFFGAQGLHCSSRAFHAPCQPVLPPPHSPRKASVVCAYIHSSTRSVVFCPSGPRSPGLSNMLTAFGPTALLYCFGDDRREQISSSRTHPRPMPRGWEPFFQHRKRLGREPAADVGLGGRPRGHR